MVFFNYLGTPCVHFSEDDRLTTQILTVGEKRMQFHAKLSSVESFYQPWKSDITFCQYRSSWNLTIWVAPPSHCKNLLRFCNCCHLLHCNTNFLKNFVLIIWVCKHSDFQFERKQKNFQYVKNIPKNRVKPYFSEWFLIIEKNVVCAQIRNLSAYKPK